MATINEVSTKIDNNTTNILSAYTLYSEWDGEDITSWYPTGSTLTLPDEGPYSTGIFYTSGDTIPSGLDTNTLLMLGDNNGIFSLVPLRSDSGVLSWDDEYTVHDYNASGFYSDAEHTISLNAGDRPDTIYAGDGCVYTKLGELTFKSALTDVAPGPTPSSYNKPLMYNEDLDAITKNLDNLEVVGKLRVNDDVEFLGDTEIDGDFDVNGDATIEGTVSATDVNATNINTTGNASINGTLTVNGDAYINGTTHTVTTEDVSATGDILTLRSNNPSGLANHQVSGVVINKYNGSDDLAIVSDNSGTVRVGTGTGTDTSYTKIALKHSDSKYYTYDDTDPDDIQYTILSPQPTGSLTSWTNKQEVVGYTLYGTAVFTEIDETSLEPLATRAEENDMSDNALVKWDASNIEIQTVLPQSGKRIVLEDATDGIEFAPNPTSNGQVLQAQYEAAGSQTYYTDGNETFDINGDPVTPHAGTPTLTSLGLFINNASRVYYVVTYGGLDYTYDYQFNNIASIQFPGTATGNSYEITTVGSEYYARIEDALSPGTYIYWDTNNEFGSDWTQVTDATLLATLAASTYDTYVEYEEAYGIVGTTDNGTTWYKYTNFETQSTQITDNTFDVNDAVEINKAVVTWSAGTGYVWGSITAGAAAFIGTQAQFDVAKLIPAGQPGYIADGTLVVITDADQPYLIGEDQA